MADSEEALQLRLARAEAIAQLASVDDRAELYRLAVEALAAHAAPGAAVYEPAGDFLSRTVAAGAVELPAGLPMPPGWPALAAEQWTRVSEDGRVDVAVVAGGKPAALLTMAPAGLQDEEAFAFQQRLAAVLGTAVTRSELIRRLTARERHFIAAQRISHVGSYDFEIASNTNDWSDQLYRIYGREPGSFNASYEKFLEMVHPDDREKIIGVHQEALAHNAAYDMEERVVWPDGQVRTLASWGEVVPDAEGKPARMIGICWDITEQKQTAEALLRSSERFEQLIESAPDVVLVIAATGEVQQVNRRLQPVLGWRPEQVVGRPVGELLPGGLVAGESTARHADGREVPVDISTSVIASDDGTVTAAFVRDATDRKRAESLALRLHDDDVRRRHALEINDNVVQGLASVLYLLDLQRTAPARAATQQTMDAAQAMMSDLLSGSAAAALMPGDLVREQGHVGSLQDVVPPVPTARPGGLRVVLADDADDIRLLLRFTLTTESGFDVVGEARNGLEAVQLAESLQPHVVVLDLSMPVMDGLQAIPELLRVCPDVRIVVLSGFDEARMQEVALQLGAHRYVEKGAATSELVDALSSLFPDRVLTAPEAPRDPEAGLAFDGDMVVHELRTPLTVITGMLSTLRERMDTLPSATTAELLAAALRNAAQMADLLNIVSDARRAEHGLLPIVPEPTDIGQLVRSCVADVCAAHDWQLPEVTAPEGLVASVDPVRICQVLTNLVSNARKFSPTGSPVRVAVEASEVGLTVSVTDEGPGVPEQRRGELFSKFARLGQQGPGMGLGLYISRAIARAHGGDLAIGSDGRTFVLSLPVRVPAA